VFLPPRDPRVEVSARIENAPPDAHRSQLVRDALSERRHPDRQVRGSVLDRKQGGGVASGHAWTMYLVIVPGNRSAGLALPNTGTRACPQFGNGV
jgi:hypothetical protein